MSNETHVPVDNHPDLVRDRTSHAIINKNRSAYEQAKRGEQKKLNKLEMKSEMLRDK